MLKYFICRTEVYDLSLKYDLFIGIIVLVQGQILYSGGVDFWMNLEN